MAQRSGTTGWCSCRRSPSPNRARCPETPLAPSGLLQLCESQMKINQFAVRSYDVDKDHVVQKKHVSLELWCQLSDARALHTCAKRAPFEICDVAKSAVTFKRRPRYRRVSEKLKNVGAGPERQTTAVD